MNQTNYLINRF